MIAMKMVTIYHPDLPDQSSTVPESAVPHHARAGWTTEKPDWAVEQEKQEQAAREKAQKEQARREQAQKQTEAPETSGASSLERSPRRRRHTEEGES